MTMSTT